MIGGMDADSTDDRPVGALEATQASVSASPPGNGGGAAAVPAVRVVDAVALSGRFPLLTGASITVAQREIVHLTGPNGAGKTSLLRLCAGLVRAQSGTVEVLGVDVVAAPDQVRPLVGYLGHGSGLYSDLTVDDNIGFWTRRSGADDQSIAAALDVCAVTERLRGLRVSQLSEGQRKRVALAMIVIRRPMLWLLDEPHAALDAASRDRVDQLIRTAASAGATVVMSSHELDRATALATRSAQLTGGFVTESASETASQPGARP